jgi:hypothetical protein
MEDGKARAAQVTNPFSAHPTTRGVGIWGNAPATINPPTAPAPAAQLPSLASTSSNSDLDISASISLSATINVDEKDFVIPLKYDNHVAQLKVIKAWLTLHDMEKANGQEWLNMGVVEMVEKAKAMN